MKYSILGFNQIEVMNINKELGLEVMLKRNPDWKPNNEDIIVNTKEGTKTRKRPQPKMPKISTNDLLVLRWFVDFYGTNDMVKIMVDSELYGWVKYQGLLEDLPILDINKDSLKTLFDNLVDFKILKHKTIRNEMGTFAVYYFGENYKRLLKEVKDNECKNKDKERYVENNEVGVR